MNEIQIFTQNYALYLFLFSAGLFVCQFILTIFGGDIHSDASVDTDIDVGDGGMSFSDIISFKGLIHFLIGFSGWLTLTKPHNAMTYLVAVICGIVLVFLLVWVYHMMYKLDTYHKNYFDISKLVGTNIVIGNMFEGKGIASYNCNTGTNTISVISMSNRTYKYGDVVEVLKVENGIAYIK